jgi:hypothetical protein
MLPGASRQCVAAESAGVSVAAEVPLIVLEGDCTDAANAPQRTSDDASSAVFKICMRVSLYAPATRLESGAFPSSTSLSVVAAGATAAAGSRELARRLKVMQSNHWGWSCNSVLSFWPLGSRSTSVLSLRAKWCRFPAIPPVRSL